MRLAAINVSLRGAVDENIEFQCTQCPPEFCVIPKIELGVVKPCDREAWTVQAAQRRTQTAACAKNDSTQIVFLETLLHALN